MDVQGKIVAVTGAGAGIGKALVQRLAAAGAAHVAVVDVDGDAAAATAASVNGSAYTVDCGRGEQIADFIADVEARHGPIDLYCSNAGVIAGDPDSHNCASAADAAWQKSWAVNVMAHVHAARVLLPSMIARRSGYFLITASAAGLLSMIGSAAYATTKHAAIGFAESLALTHKDDGVRVSVLCPQAVDTAMARGNPLMGADIDGFVSADHVAQCALEGLRDEHFLILPHQSVAHYRMAKAENYDRWIGGMAKLRRAIIAQA
jgi:NAD(P)-dependent dehydrogenase (short-subunit alcohol dehydrogenase family)